MEQRQDLEFQHQLQMSILQGNIEVRNMEGIVAKIFSTVQKSMRDLLRENSPRLQKQLQKLQMKMGHTDAFNILVTHQAIGEIGEQLIELQNANTVSARDANEQSFHIMEERVPKIIENLVLEKKNPMNFRPEDVKIMHQLFHQMYPLPNDISRFSDQEPEKLQVEHIPEVAHLYAQSEITRQHVLLVLEGKFDVLNELGKGGLFIKPFDEHEGPRMEEMLNRTRWQLQCKTFEKRHESELMLGHFYRDPASGEMDTVVIQTTPAIPTPREKVEAFFGSPDINEGRGGVSGGKMNYRTKRMRSRYFQPMLNGQVLQLFFMASRRKGLISGLIASTIEECLRLMPELSVGLTYYLQSCDFRVDGVDIESAFDVQNVASGSSLHRARYVPFATETELENAWRQICVGESAVDFRANWEHTGGALRDILVTCKKISDQQRKK